MIVLLDMDGLIADWTKSVAELMCVDYDNLIKNWPEGIYDTAEALGVSDSDMWKEIDKNRTFWEDIEPYPYAQKFVKDLKSKYNVFICSSPSRSPRCIESKLRWLDKYKFGFGRNFVFTPQKYLLANPNTVLIDDLNKNTDKFSSHGGKIITFPQPWNFNRELFYKGLQLDYVMERLDMLSGN